MVQVSSVFEKKLRERVDTEIARRTEILTAGSAVQDYAAYREHVAHISALRKLHELCEEVNADLNKTV